jgi:predicted metal-dependent peptidase
MRKGDTMSKYKPFSQSGETAVRLMLRHPYFMVVYYSMQLFELPPDWPPPFNTLATNGVSLWVAKAFWDQLNRDQKMTAVAHECGHKMYLHPTRRGERDPAGWNIAGDHRINLDLKASGFTPLEGLTINGQPWSWFCDEKYNQPQPWTTEAIYDDIMQQAQDEAQGEGDGSVCGIGKVLKKWLGSASDLIDFGEDGDGKPDDTPGSHTGKESVIEFEARVRRELKEMEAQARMAGDVPLWMKKVIEFADHAQVNWWEVVENLLRGLHTMDYSWRRMHKKEFIKTGAIAPDMYSPAIGGVKVYTDCSGSCWSVLPKFNMHFRDIIEQLRPAWVEVSYFQTEVMHELTQRFERGEVDVEMQRTGGGGTDFSWLADDVEAMPEPPEVIFFLTDMIGGFGREVEGIPVYFLSVSHITEAPFGEVIAIR